MRTVPSVMAVSLTSGAAAVVGCCFGARSPCAAGFCAWTGPASATTPASAPAINHCFIVASTSQHAGRVVRGPSVFDYIGRARLTAHRKVEEQSKCHEKSFQLPAASFQL